MDRACCSVLFSWNFRSLPLPSSGADSLTEGTAPFGRFHPSSGKGPRGWEVKNRRGLIYSNPFRRTQNRARYDYGSSRGLISRTLQTTSSRLNKTRLEVLQIPSPIYSWCMRCAKVCFYGLFIFAFAVDADEQ
ncbi:unnamed protein product [Scytosiphon promiscuus]